MQQKHILGWAELFAILGFFYICDRTDTFPRSDKVYDRDQYWFLWSCLLFGAVFSIRKIQPIETPEDPPGHVKPLPREQTEEWKGWMQIQFLMYHYFNATELYNTIRLYIAAYVWQTGFGNFSFYYVKKDFSAHRFWSMMWRLNFLVIPCCIVLNNQYMLYYICMLHTFFTIIIFLPMSIKPELNTTRAGILGKFGLVSLIILIVWEYPGVFEVVWSPFSFLVGFNPPAVNGKLPKQGLHEWQFRSTLDHWVFLGGIFTAWNHPHFNSWLVALDQMPLRKQYAIKTAVTTVCLIIGYKWLDIFFLNKYEYNKLHPYTSVIPITLYIVLRNIFTTARNHYMHIFTWLGKITLETYIAQFHIWMVTSAPNASPKQLLRILPEGYPLLNFAVVSAIYIFLSYRLQNLTMSLKESVFDVVLPKPKPEPKPEPIADSKPENSV